MKMKLENILQGISVVNSNWNKENPISKLSFDSRNVDENTLFFAIVGSTTDGHKYIDDVIKKGCYNIVVQDNREVRGINFIQVKDSAETVAIAAHNFFGKPSDKLKMVGVTGTNGKTTTTTLLHSLFQSMGYQTGLLSTVVNKIGTEEIPATHTTPNPIALAELLAKMVENGCSHVFMEVSSHAIHQKRTAALCFDIAVFTNITHDHLDYHKTFKEYIEVKKTLFDNLSKESFALTNSDDKNGMVMLQNTKASKSTYSLKTPSDYKGKIIENELTGLILQINGREVYTQLIGEFNAYNLLAVYGVTQLLEMDSLEVLTAMSTLKSVDGRFEFFKSASNITCIVDYAHTPDALENVLKTISSFRKEGNKVISLVGCGGDRDKTKRPQMAQIASRMSNQTILTSDNPRTEDPNTILEEMEAGIPEENQAKNITISDRKEAIKLAISLAQSNDILLIAGKGHEKYQDIKGVKHPFDDLAIAKELFIKMKK
jgi:UDP-N-acetylmuramoyl-L-alanyl-D-glutamate--2,6-diaminopimelate ligase|tara:strand:- start:2465 stop:3925 length:1461 start_codon:yes stop_codon:yes gene_type:complete